MPRKQWVIYNSKGSPKSPICRCLQLKVINEIALSLLRFSLRIPAVN